MKLLSYERTLLATYVMTPTREERARILDEAIKNPKVSGSLINAYRVVEEML